MWHAIRVCHSKQHLCNPCCTVLHMCGHMDVIEFEDCSGDFVDYCISSATAVKIGSFGQFRMRALKFSIHRITFQSQVLIFRQDFGWNFRVKLLIGFISTGYTHSERLRLFSTQNIGQGTVMLCV